MKAYRPYRGIRVLPLAALLLAGPAAADPERAGWVDHEVDFRYVGFTTHYTCDGIRSKVKLLLRTLGAREDITITGACAGSLSEPRPYQNMKLGFSIPAPAADDAAEDQTFAAAYRDVQLSPYRPRGLESGDCELVDQFRRQIIEPVFAPRAVEGRTACTPHHVNVGKPNLRVSVLMPVDAEQ